MNDPSSFPSKHPRRAANNHPAGAHPRTAGPSSACLRTFSWILSALSISAKIIADKVRRARLENVLGSAGAENVQGEVQQKLDVLANDVLLATLGAVRGRHRRLGGKRGARDPA